MEPLSWLALTLRYHRSDIVLHATGSVPDRRLSLTSSIVTLFNTPHAGRSRPVSALRLRKSVRSRSIACHSAGSVPRRSLPSSTSVCSTASPPHDGDSGPVSALPESRSSVRRVSRPQLAGSVPETRSPRLSAAMLKSATAEPFTLSARSGRTTGDDSRGRAKLSLTPETVQLTCTHAQ
ncbi:hypothetical protein NESM_000900900 [Novymonas esmeraldas]|uniref:Uncharacterized protein n=1 Tax=Novymonas esmeraldas TaxID=1808958 RepID=A0AAW0F2K0_9TRYP